MLKKIQFCESYCLGCFLHCTAVLNCVRATHGLPADRAPVQSGCPCRDPLGCPLIPRQDGIRDKAPTLWLLLWTETGMCWLRVRACDHHWTCCHKHTPSVEYTCRGFRPIRLALCRTAHLQSELVGEGHFHIPCHARWAICLQHQLMIFVAITRATVHLVNTIAGSTRIQLTIINDFAHLFICSLLPSGNQKYNRDCNLCAHRHTSRAGRNCGLQRSTTRSRNCICRISTVFELSGWLVFRVVPPLSHRQFYLWWYVLGNDLIQFHHFFHDLKHGKQRLSVPRCAAEYAPVGSVAQLQRFPQWRVTPLRSQIRPQVFDQHLTNILCRRTVHSRGNL